MTENMAAASGKIERTTHSDEVANVINSSRLQRYFGVEVVGADAECTIEDNNRRNKPKIKHLQSNNERKGSIHHNSKKKKRGRSKSKRRKKLSKRDRSASVSSSRSKRGPYPGSPTHSDIESDRDSIQMSEAPKVSRFKSLFDRFQNHTNPHQVPSDSPGTDNLRSDFSCTFDVDVTHPPSASIWRPSLNEMYGNRQLLDALQAFMRRICCSEHILFLLAVREFQRDIDRYIYPLEDSMDPDSFTSDDAQSQIRKDIDSQILSIFHKYIIDRAELQVEWLLHREQNTEQNPVLRSRGAFTR